MGACNGKADGHVALDGDDNKENIASGGSNEGSVGNVRPKPDFETRWKDDIVAIWSRDISKLPVHTDVPRLSKKISIKGDAGDFIFDGSDAKYKTTSNTAITKMLLLAFSKAVDDRELRNALKKWEEFVPESGDTGEHLLAFFASLAPDAKDTGTLLVLKAIHQRIIFPAFYYLKDLLQKDMGKFKDKRGSWSVDIHVGDNGIVKVVHKKRQQSVNVTLNNQPEFEFDWNLILTIDIKNKTMSKEIIVNLSELDISGDVPADQTKRIRDTFEEHKLIS